MADSRFWFYSKTWDVVYLIQEVVGVLPILVVRISILISAGACIPGYFQISPESRWFQKTTI